jgi:hypothetical protein
MSDLEKFYELLDTIPEVDRADFVRLFSEKVWDREWCDARKIKADSIYFHDFLKALREIRIAEYGYHPKNYRIKYPKR